MTNEIAKDIFDFLLEEFKKNELTDIFTFLIEDSSYLENIDKYEYYREDPNPEEKLRDLESSSNDPKKSKEALKSLLNASISYFEYAYNIPKKLEEKMKYLDIDPKSPRITLDFMIDEKDVNKINESLNNPKLKEILEILNLINDSLEKNDDSFLNDI